ncbi:MAG: GreA/GreB family elongation factor [Anaerolineae bacterium]
MGKALIGRKVDDMVTFEAPGGKVEMKLISIE